MAVRARARVSSLWDSNAGYRDLNQEGGFSIRSELPSPTAPNLGVPQAGKGGGGGSFTDSSSRTFTSFYVPTDSLYGDQWHLNDPSVGINVQGVWNDYTGAGVHVGVFDEGIQSNHTDLDGNYDPTRHVTTLDTLNDGGAVDLFDFHGTAVAGLIAAENNGSGTVGVAFGADVTGVNIFAPGWNLYIDYLLNEQEGFDITNHSWGFTNFYADNRTASHPFWDFLFAGIEDAAWFGRGGLGTIQVHAAGNGRFFSGGGHDDDTNLHGVKNSRFVVAVAAVGSDGFVSYYSTPGTSLLVSAPSSGAGDGIVTTDRQGLFGYDDGTYSGTGNYTDSFGGTSAAAPIITGVIALMLDANPELGWRDVQDILAASARHVGGAIGGGLVGFEDYGWVINSADDWNGGGYHYSGDYGFGLVNALAAVRLAESWNRSGTIWTEWFATAPTVTGSWTVSDAAATVINITGTPSLETESVEVTLTWSTPHTWSDDLDMTLISPSGTVYYLIKDAGADADTPTAWTFMTRAFMGELSGGAWTLIIQDDFAGDSGVLSSVTLTAYGSYTSAGDHLNDGLYIFTNEYSDMVALQGSRTTIRDIGNVGIDTLNFAAVSSAVNINMAPSGICTIDGVVATIHAGSLFEIVYCGDGADTVAGNNAANQIYGGRGNDTLSGGSGADLLDGQAGADSMSGGGGNDTYIVNVGGDVTTESSAAGGVDTVRSAVTRTLGANLEHLTLTGTAAINGNGNTLNNTIIGNDAVNTLNGSSGNDKLNGGLGLDRLTGGTGNDTFIFNTTVANSNRDTITDYNVAQDTIQLENAVFTAFGATGVLGAAAFYIGAAAHDANDRIIYNAANGALIYDANGNAAGGAVQFATLAAGLALTNADFVII